MARRPSPTSRLDRVYRLLFNLVFLRMSPERAHELAFGLIRTVGRVPVLRGAIARLAAAPAGGEVRTLGRTFPGAFGLAAGFDKNARAVEGLAMLGFGFVEVGTVTAYAQPGNDAPRLWRVVDQQALRNRIGSKAFFGVLRAWPTAHRHGDADTAGFIAFVERRTGRHLDGFFHRWLYSSGKPAL